MSPPETLGLPTRARRVRRLLGVLAVLGLYVGGIATLAWRHSAVPEVRTTARCEARDGAFYRGTEKLLVKAVGYDPARPGELPWSRERSQAMLDEDFRRIRAAGFNTVRVWEPLDPAALDVAARHELSVIQGIWIDPEGAFADPAFRAAAVERATEAARGVAGHPAVLAWLVMNEPRPETVLAQGIGPTRQLLREVADAVRAADPGVPVGFASWPGLEMLDEPSLDFVAANLYPFRPGKLLEGVGYEGLVQVWRDRAGERPLLVSEYGVSVAPGTIAPDAPGGVTEEGQAVALPRHADAVMRAGAVGGSLFMWIDGWWKNNEVEGDERSHDPDDGEEWFGLVAMDTLEDGAGRERPAFEAMRRYNAAVLTLPADGPVGAREVELEAYVEAPGPVTAEVALEGGPWTVVPVVREGSWIRGRAGLLAEGDAPQHLAVRLHAPDGESRFDRVLLPPGTAPEIRLEAIVQGESRALVATLLDGAGRPMADTGLRLALSEPSRRFDALQTLVTDAEGHARAEIYVPKDVVMLATVALREGDAPPLALTSLVLGAESR